MLTFVLGSPTFVFGIKIHYGEERNLVLLKDNLSATIYQ